MPDQDDSWQALLPHLEAQYGLPEGLLSAVIAKESSGKADAKGKAGERGLMQIMPGTAKHYGVDNPDALADPKTNVSTGARILGDLMKAYNGDIHKVLRAYNGGPKAARTPTAETTAYADSVLKRLKPEDETPVPFTPGTGFSEGKPNPDAVPVMTGTGFSSGTMPPTDATGPVLEIPPIRRPSGDTGPVLEIPSNVDNLAIAPAIRAGNKIIPGAKGETHKDIIDRTPDLPDKVEHGFIDNSGLFRTRREMRNIINSQGGNLGPGQPDSRDLKPKPGIAQQIVGALSPAEAFAAELPKTYSEDDFAAEPHPKGGRISPGAPVFQKPIPRAAEIAEEYVIAPGLMGLGAVGGGAAGTAVAPGPGTAAGTVAGAAAGSAAADVLNAEINKRFFGRDYSLSQPGTLPGFEHPYGGLEQSAVEAGAFEGAGHYGVPALRSALRGEGMAARAAIEAAATQDAANAAQAAAAKAQLQAKRQTLKNEVVDRIAADKAKLQKQILEEQAPREARTRLEAMLGKTPDEVAAAQALPPEQTGPAALPGERAVARRKAVQNAVFGPIRRAVKALGERYDQVFAKYDKKLIDASSLQDTIADENNYIAQRNIVLSPKAKALLKLAANETSDDSGGLLTRRARAEGYRDWGELAADDPELAEQISETLAPPGTTTIGRLRGLRSQAAALMSAGQSANDQALGYHMVSKIDDILGQSGVPKAAELNAQYAFHKHVFNRAVTRDVATEIEPANLGKVLWEEPQRALLLWDGATPEEKQVLRENFADYVLSNGFDPHKLGQKVNRDVLRRIFGDTAFGREKVWFDTEAKAVGWDTLIQKSPEAKAAYEKAIQDRLRELGEYRSAQFKAEALKLAKDLGPAGNAIIAKINAAKTPQEAAAVAADEFDRLMPGEAAAQLASTQKGPARAYYEQLQRNPPRTITPELTSRDEAAIRALQKLPPSKLYQFATRRAQWILPIAAAMALGGGHVSPYFEYGPLVIGALAGLGGWQQLFRRSLRNPETAELFWRALNQPMRGDGVRSFGRMMTDLAVNTAIGEATQAAKRAQGLGPNSTPAQPQSYREEDFAASP